MASKKSPPRKLKAGRRTVRTQGMSQSAFAGYGTQQPPAPPPAKPEAAADQETQETTEDKADGCTGESKENSP